MGAGAHSLLRRAAWTRVDRALEGKGINLTTSEKEKAQPRGLGQEMEKQMPVKRAL